jgi:hypothetical protein
MKICSGLFVRSPKILQKINEIKIASYFILMQWVMENIFLIMEVSR